MRKTLPLLLWMAFCSGLLRATPPECAIDFPSSGPYQSLSVSGKVSDQLGAGMPGVNIIVKGTSVGTTTDAAGAYKLDLNNDMATGTLVFSFIGYATQEQALNGRTQIDITMAEDVRALNEIVV